MQVYFDSSALMKLVLDEQGRGMVLALLEVATTPATGRIAYPECHAALAAAARAGRVSEPLLRSGVGALRSIDQALTVIGVDGALSHHAGELAERHGLRGHDAVHLATALTLQSPGRPVIFASWDRRRHQAAFDAGLTPAPALL